MCAMRAEPVAVAPQRLTTIVRAPRSSVLGETSRRPMVSRGGNACRNGQKRRLSMATVDARPPMNSPCVVPFACHFAACRQRRDLPYSRSTNTKTAQSAVTKAWCRAKAPPPIRIAAVFPSRSSDERARRVLCYLARLVIVRNTDMKALRERWASVAPRGVGFEPLMGVTP